MKIETSSQWTLALSDKEDNMAEMKTAATLKTIEELKQELEMCIRDRACTDRQGGSIKSKL